jgi:hypothetical protein
MQKTAASFDENRVRILAHSLWVEEGKPHGRDKIHWMKALEMAKAEAVAVIPDIVTPVKKAASKPKAKAPGAAARKVAPRKRG